MTLEGANRTILFAVLASLALHVALFLMLPLLRDTQSRRNAPDSVFARLSDVPARSIAEPAPTTPPAEQSEPEAPRLAEPKRVSPQAAPKRTKTPSATPSSSAALAPANVTAPAPPSTPPVAEAPDAGTLAQYRLSLMSAARRFKSYPHVAVDRNWQGNVEVRMAIAANGEIASLTVRSSAGHSVLDQHALEMIERAKAIAPIPPALRGKQFAVDIPVEFVLREAG